MSKISCCSVIHTNKHYCRSFIRRPSHIYNQPVPGFNLSEPSHLAERSGDPSSVAVAEWYDQLKLVIHSTNIFKFIHMTVCMAFACFSVLDVQRAEQTKHKHSCFCDPA